MELLQHLPPFADGCFQRRGTIYEGVVGRVRMEADLRMNFDTSCEII
jgi:hypothetical protein